MPNRILKESICVSDSIDGLSWFEEVLFYRLIVNCDDFGRFDGRIAVIKNRLFPLKENLTSKTVSEAINRLASTGLVVLYEFEGKPYLYLPTWNDHQSVRAKRSKYPEPACITIKRENICNQMQADVPVIQSNTKSNPNPNPNPNSASKPAQASPFYNENRKRVISDYLNRVNPSASQRSLEELGGYAEDLGADVCIRAIDEAVDAKKANWNYLRAILRNLQAQGIKSLSDWDAREATREAAKNPKTAEYTPGAAELDSVAQLAARRKQRQEDNNEGL